MSTISDQVRTIQIVSGNAITPNPHVVYQNNSLIYTLPVGLNLDNGIEVCLQSMYISYSWFNLSTALNNVTFSYIFNGVTYNLTIPAGFYAYSDGYNDLYNWFVDSCVQNGTYLLDNNGNPQVFINWVENPVYYGLTFTFTPIPTVLPTGWTNPAAIALSGNSPQLIINNNNLQYYLGLAAGTYPTVPATIVTYVNSNNPNGYPPAESNVQSVNVTCNMVNNSLIQGNTSLIANFPPNTQFGGQISYLPTQFLWQPTSGGVYSNIIFKFLDQGNNQLYLQDSTGITINILLRRKPKT